MLTRKIFELDSLKCHFLDFGERFYRILMVRKRHCDISEALANVFALSPKLGGPHLAHWGWAPPGFSRSEPIVVTPLLCINGKIWSMFLKYPAKMDLILMLSKFSGQIGPNVLCFIQQFDRSGRVNGKRPLAPCYTFFNTNILKSCF